MVRRELLVVSAILLAALGVTRAAKAEILIGMAGPLTGPNAWPGEQIERGVTLAVADINARGGVLGQQVEVVTADDYCDDEQAVAAANKLVAVGVVFVAGHWCSHASILASDIYRAAGVLMISPGSTNPMLTERGLANVFRVVGRDDQQGTIAGNYLANHWRDQSIVIVHDGQAYGRGLAEETKRQLNARGGREVLFTEITPGEVDYGVLVAELSAVGADVLYYGGYAPEAALIIRRARHGGDDLQLVVGDGVASQDFWLVAGPAGEGTMLTAGPDPRNDPAAAAIVARFRDSGYEPEGFTLYAYAAVQAWVAAAEKAGTLDYQAVIASLHAHEFDTVLGRISFDDKGDVRGFEPFVWYVWQDGDYAPAAILGD